MPKPSLYEVLRDAQADVNQWLQYGEAKNGVLLTLDMALIVGIGTIATAWSEIPVPIVATSIAMCGGLLISAGVALVSFFPKLEKHGGLRDGSPAANGNLFFFGDIAKYDPYSYVDELSKSIGTKETTAEIHKYLSNQIVTNSRIAIRKFNLFRVGLKIGAYAISAPLLGLLTYWGSL